MTTTFVRAFRRTALPLTSYYIVTLALPLANGAAASGAAFAGHALVVLVVPPILIVLGCALHVLVRAVHRCAMEKADLGVGITPRRSDRDS